MCGGAYVERAGEVLQKRGANFQVVGFAEEEGLREGAENVVFVLRVRDRGAPFRPPA